MIRWTGLEQGALVRGVAGVAFSPCGGALLVVGQDSIVRAPSLFTRSLKYLPVLCLKLINKYIVSDKTLNRKR